LGVIWTPWDALAERLGRPYSAPSWVVPWHRHVACEAELRCVVVEEGDGVIGVAPFSGSRENGVRTYRMTSASGGGTPKQPLAVPGCEATVATEMARCLSGLRSRPHLVAIDGLPVSGPWRRALVDAWQPQSRVYDEFTRPLTWIDVSVGSVDGWLDTKGTSFRKNVKRLGRRLGERGADFSVSTEPADLDAAIDAFAALHDAQWGRRGGSAVMTRSSPAMLRDVGQHLDGTSRFWIATIEVEGRTIAAEVFVRAGAVAVDWLGGFDNAWARFSPGLLVMMAGMVHAIAVGATTVELGAGRQPFKYRLADGEEDLAWVLVVPPGTGPGSAAAKTLALGRVARRRAASRARSVRSSIRRGAAEDAN
jgi:CelD/BcsL family acetyltransferase involved in cellulose biosynthesis